MQPIPSAVGRYRIDRVLGAGAFASVWLGHDDALASPVAIKVLSPSLIDDLDVRNRFLEEARILRRADSERLIRVHDIGELPDGRPYFVMPYADRGTLSDRMRERQLPVDEALALAEEIAYGVEVINRLGIIHRDLKPSNVLFQTAPDGSERLLIADLGLAKALAHASGAFTLPVGTPGYMSPEQARFGGGLDVRADVYGLGALTYHLLTGRAPGPAPVKIPPTGLRAELGPQFDDVVLRAMEVERELRWPTAEAFARALATLRPSGAHGGAYAFAGPQQQPPPARPGPDAGDPLGEMAAERARERMGGRTGEQVIPPVVPPGVGGQTTPPGTFTPGTTVIDQPGATHPPGPGSASGTVPDDDGRTLAFEHGRPQPAAAGEHQGGQGPYEQHGRHGEPGRQGQHGRQGQPGQGPAGRPDPRDSQEGKTVAFPSPQGGPHQGPAPQGGPYQGGPPHGGPPQGGPPQGAPPQGGQPPGGPPHGGPYQGGPPQGGHPHGGPPQGGPYQGGPPQGDPHGGPYQGGPQAGPHPGPQGGQGDQGGQWQQPAEPPSGGGRSHTPRHRQPNGSGGGRRLPVRLIVIIAAVLVIAIVGGLLIGNLLSGDDGGGGGGGDKKAPPVAKDTATVSDASGKLSVTVPKAWPKGAEETWTPSVVGLTDAGPRPVLRATPDVARFRTDKENVPGVFLGLTTDVAAGRLPPPAASQHPAACPAKSGPESYKRGTLSGTITRWTGCNGGKTSITEVGLKDAGGKFGLWIRIKQVDGVDRTKQILDSVKATGP